MFSTQINSNYKPHFCADKTNKKAVMSQQNIFFGAGNIFLKLDSDGTYFPSDDQSILMPENRNTSAFKRLKNAFEGLNNFFDRFHNNIKFTITTGRNVGEYDYWKNLVKNAGINVPIPDKLITKNGGDSFLKDRQKKLKNGQLEPEWPSSGYVDNKKREEIRKLTNWDADYIRSSILTSLKDWDLPVLFAQSGLKDYGAKSYKQYWESTFKNYCDNLTAFMRDDGDLNFYIGLPINALKDKGNKQAFNLVKDSIITEITSRLDEKNIKYNLEYRESDWENSGGPGIAITPLINGKPLDKSYDIAKEIERAKKENDLVIIAGNGINDTPMLNPESYDLNSNNGKPLPMMSIAIGKEPTLIELAKKYPEYVIHIDEPHDLLNAVKTAIKRYAEKNNEFRNNLEPQIAKDIGL